MANVLKNIEITEEGNYNPKKNVSAPPEPIIKLEHPSDMIAKNPKHKRKKNSLFNAEDEEDFGNR